MKPTILLFFIFCCAFHMLAQPANYKVNPKAKRLDDSAIRMFTNCGASADCYKKVNYLLDEAVKIDPKWYEGWSNLISYLGRTDAFDKCLAACKKMVAAYPNAPEALSTLGVMQYETKHPADALASFSKVLKIYDNMLLKKPKVANYNDILVQKAVTLILLDREAEGKNMLRQLYKDETEPFKKSYMAFYVNKSKAEIIEDKIPGK